MVAKILAWRHTQKLATFLHTRRVPNERVSGYVWCMSAESVWDMSPSQSLADCVWQTHKTQVATYIWHETLSEGQFQVQFAPRIAANKAGMSISIDQRGAPSSHTWVLRDKGRRVIRHQLHNNCAIGFARWFSGPLVCKKFEQEVSHNISVHISDLASVALDHCPSLLSEILHWNDYTMLAKSLDQEGLD